MKQMLQRIKEHIRVAVIHGPGNRLKPVWFDWKQQKHEIREITYHWQHNTGKELLLHYSVSDGRALYEIVYNTASLIWMLESIDPDKL